ncbi:putative guanine nucleotide-binding protein alpha-1 subunit [Lobosporangium transversale]|uniref:Putative guanine nucleotide-binding protein alpha-1 subunit n=1 Tax=Lobosporangium transversale TaxID=64571 RepID=A0A1Y2GG40_9FUNG|nr:putative guanine nucleotide-binding protein alpha-1 subunit [Lobosporangium transversale]ORZ08819.1 putative guanine nucleotide-binding protein alpha-1 subunit [Lobosporangium transversale]|eukprot:XP_021878602.1 putative guanine nucleotide-binding protein alpha-1 subunit [Lobosporangium transversale]
MELSHVSGSSNGSEASSHRTSPLSLTPLLTSQFSGTRADQKRAKALSDAIDKSLRAEKEREQREGGIKLLILGPSETGKTTVLKQLKLLYGQKGLDPERQTYRRVVHLNIMKAMQALVDGLQQHSIPLGDPQNAEHLAIMSRLEPTAETDMFLELVPSIKALWADSGIQHTYYNITQLNIQDSAKYFLDAIDRVAHAQYIPTDDDILQARVRTLAVSEHVFDIDNVAYRIYDVGGQKSLRKYWAPYFDDVNAIIFMAALSAYDQPCEEDPKLNRLQECLVLFNEIANHKLFQLTSMILFLNKIDIFQRKLDAGSLVSKYFPEYRGPNDYFSTTVFFQYRFLQQCKDLQKQVYTHFTHATDTKQMRVIVVAVNAIVQRLNLRSSGLL